MGGAARSEPDNEQKRPEKIPSDPARMSSFCTAVAHCMPVTHTPAANAQVVEVSGPNDSLTLPDIALLSLTSDWERKLLI